ncbi:DUF134 domain-containing protein [Chloroflexota bacterium]
MSRPPKCRRVEFLPDVNYFKPAGTPLRALEETRLSVEEAEAIRLKDLEGLEQEQSAERMNISRPTFQRILAAARQKIADALLNGKAIRIEGGNFEMASRRFRCHNGQEWDVPLAAAGSASPEFCPACMTKNFLPLPPVGVNQGRSASGRHREGKHGGWQYAGE